MISLLALQSVDLTSLSFYFQEGKISDAENMKLKLEQAQRERRQNAEQDGKKEQDYHTPMWFRKTEKVSFLSRER